MEILTDQENILDESGAEKKEMIETADREDVSPETEQKVANENDTNVSPLEEQKIATEHEKNELPVIREKRITRKKRISTQKITSRKRMGQIKEESQNASEDIEACPEDEVVGGRKRCICIILAIFLALATVGGCIYLMVLYIPDNTGSEGDSLMDDPIKDFITSTPALSDKLN